MQIFAKLEGANPTSSIKDRIALRMVEEAEASVKLRSGSNHPRTDKREYRDWTGYDLSCEWKYISEDVWTRDIDTLENDLEAKIVW